MNLERSLNKLLREGKLRKQDTDLDYLNNLLNAADRNFRAGALLMGKVVEAAFKLIYDGLLQLGRLILLTNGLRPDDGEQHKTTFMVAGVLLGEEYEKLVRKIQKYRIKRNTCIYDPGGSISKNEAEAIYKTAQQFWLKLKGYLKNKNPQLNLFEEF